MVRCESKQKMEIVNGGGGGKETMHWYPELYTKTWMRPKRFALKQTPSVASKKDHILTPHHQEPRRDLSSSASTQTKAPCVFCLKNRPVQVKSEDDEYR
jgi:hypothetical protein